MNWSGHCRNRSLFVAISALIDKRIHANYRIFATNYVAHDLLYKEERFVEHYTAEDKKRFISYIDGQLERITLPNKDVDFLREKFAADVCQSADELSGCNQMMFLPCAGVEL